MSTEQQTNTDIPRNGAITLGPSLWPSKHVLREGWMRWAWQVLDQASGEVLHSGHTLSKRWAWHRASAAAARVYGERAAKRRVES